MRVGDPARFGKVLCLLAGTLVASSAVVHGLAQAPPCRVRLTLVDADRGATIPGVVRIRAEGAAERFRPAGLISRGWGLNEAAPISQWSVVPGVVTVELPRTKLIVDALSGIESEQATRRIDLTGQDAAELRIPIRSFSELRRRGWFSANTHLHLRDLSRQDADRYLREIPAADRLNLVFISHLERADADHAYVTNQYPPGRLKELETAGVVIAQGEEHRHNFGPQGEGYGHVMLLGITELIRPVSIGYGISKKHPDAPPLRTGLDHAHGQGGTTIWCHNNWGFEDVPNWVDGRVDAQNIFDGGSHGGFEESFYHYLNAGLRVPFSTGTDWFMTDFARCYARVEGPLTPERWLAALRAGRTFITNGPLLELRVNGREPGATLAARQSAPVRVEAVARGRLDFGRLELVHNGTIVQSSPAQRRGGHYEARLSRALDIQEPGWLAARVSEGAKSEYGYPLFAHTSPVYVTVGRRTIQRAEDLRFLLREVELGRSVVVEKARFESDSQREGVLQLYERASARLRRRLGL